MTHLTQSVRGLLVAVAALALTGGAALATHSLPPAASSGTQHASTLSGHVVPVGDAAGANGSSEKSDANEAAESTEAADNDASNKSGSTTANANRPQNHGWFVSQAATGATPAGATLAASFANHGAFVSSIAQGSLGKSTTSTGAAPQSAAGKAKAAAAHAAHQH